MAKARPLRRRLRSNLLGLLFTPLAALLGLLPWRRIQRLGTVLGRIAWHLLGRHRRRTLENLEHAFPGMPEEQRFALGRACFEHHGMNLAECLHLLRRNGRTAERHLRVEGWEHVETARSARRPILILTGHCGNWELLGAVVNGRGLGMAAIVRAQEEPVVEAFADRLRRHFGSAPITRGAPDSARQLLAVLRGGRALCVLIDQDTRVEGGWVPFFGHPAFTPTGPARIALRHRATVIPSFVERQDDGSHLVRFHPALDLHDEPLEATCQMTAAIEAQVRRRPEQWVWMHRRWRRQPEEAVARPSTTQQ